MSELHCFSGGPAGGGGGDIGSLWLAFLRDVGRFISLSFFFGFRFECKRLKTFFSIVFIFFSSFFSFREFLFCRRRKGVSLMRNARGLFQPRW